MWCLGEAMNIVNADSVANGIAKLSDKIKDQAETIEKLERLILNCYEACLCERSTKGFDYSDNHPVLGNEVGSRFNTPKVMIKGTIGCEWVYKHPIKSGDSMERLKFKTISHGEGYKSDKEWKALSEIKGKG